MILRQREAREEGVAMRNPIATWGKITRLRINKDVVKRFILGVLLAAVTSVNIPVVGITMEGNEQ